MTEFFLILTSLSSKYNIWMANHTDSCSANCWKVEHLLLEVEVRNWPNCRKLKSHLICQLLKMYVLLGPSYLCIITMNNEYIWKLHIHSQSDKTIPMYRPGVSLLCAQCYLLHTRLTYLQLKRLTFPMQAWTCHAHWYYLKQTLDYSTWLTFILRGSIHMYLCVHS